MHHIDPIDPNLNTQDHERSTTDLDGTIAAVDSGVTLLAPGPAGDLIEGWIQAIQHSGRTELEPIVTNLRALRVELSADRLDGAAIGALLIDLGDGTTQAATDAADERLTPALERLGAGLRRAGEALVAGRPEDAA